MTQLSTKVGFVSLNIALLTVSDSRDSATDKSGDKLSTCLTDTGHRLADRQWVKDDIYAIRAVVCQWIAAADIDVILTTGGTGFTARDSTPDALMPLFDRVIDGYGELFRHLSYARIGTSTIQSRALAGIANRTVIFSIPGSTNACQMAWEEIIKAQLDRRHRPCNFVEMITFHKDNRYRE